MHVGNGVDQRWKGSIVWQGKKSASVYIEEGPERSVDPVITLISALPKPQRRDWMLEKATELGLTEFLPCEFERSARERLPVQRFERVVREAASQSRRWYLPQSSKSVQSRDLPELLKDRMRNGTNVYLLDLPVRDNLLEPLDLFRSLEKAESRTVVVGPEGGFTHGERDEWALLREDFPQQCFQVALGKNVLRVETAAIAFLSYLSISMVGKLNT